MDSLIQNSLLVKEGKKVSVLSSLQQMLLLFEKLWDVEIRKKMWRQFYFDFCRSKGQIRRHYGGKNLSKMSKICQKCVISGSAWTMHWCIIMKTSIKHNLQSVQAFKYLLNYTYKGLLGCKGNYRKICGLFKLQNTAMESEHNNTFLSKRMTNTWKFLLF